jgi:redox-sensitive bicupin YhaK (pirin superfamily)
MTTPRWTRRELLRAGLALPAGLALGCKGPFAAATGRIREAAEVFAAVPTIEGAGVKLRRALGTRALSVFDPFLLLDEIHSDRPDDYLPGFPRHPHRGFETVTYMIEGLMEHRDSVGNSGRLGPGSVQWMTAGRGIIHSEMPHEESKGLWGFQLWVNLPAAQKMISPRYQDIVPARIPERTLAGARVRVIAGALGDARGPVEGIVTAPEMLDVHLDAGASFDQPNPAGRNAVLYAIAGHLAVGTRARPVRAGEIALLPATPAEETLRVRATGAARFLFLAARPLGEPVARYGPFVMNTEAEIRKALEDYRTGRLLAPPS